MIYEILYDSFGACALAGIFLAFAMEPKKR
jgi:hypothetical protein